MTKRDAFEIIAGERIELMCGDFFATSSTNIGEGPIEAVYDRAALVALPEVMRALYVAHLLALVGPEAQILLVTLDHD